VVEEGIDLVISETASSGSRCAIQGFSKVQRGPSWEVDHASRGCRFRTFERKS